MRSHAWLVCGLMVLAGGVALAASLDDFKQAAQRDGCDSIPYDDLRSTCKSKADVVEEWCKGKRGPRNCDDLDPAGLTKRIVDVKSKIEDLKREKDNLEHDRDNAKDDDARRAIDDKIKSIADKIAELQNKVEEWERTLYDEKHQIDDRIYTGEQCIDGRKAVRDAFASAKSRAQSESDPEIKPYADKLVSYWESKEPGTRSRSKTPSRRAITVRP